MYRIWGPEKVIFLFVNQLILIDMRTSTFFAIFVIVICIVLGMLCTRCKTNHVHNTYDVYYEYDVYNDDTVAVDTIYRQIDPLWLKFLECSKDQGDAGCDSCYVAIYGRHVWEQ